MTITINRRDLLRASVLAGGALAAPGLLSGALEQAAEAAQAANLSFLLAGNYQTLAQMQKLMTSFQKLYPNITVKPSVVPWANYDQRIDLLLAANTPPAVWFPAANRGYRYYAARNFFPSVDPFIAASHYDIGDYYPSLINFCKWKGQHVALPADWFGFLIVYNKTLFDKAKLPYPPTDWNDRSWDYDKFLEYAKELTIVQGGKTVQWGAAPTDDDRFPFWQFGGDAFTEQDYVTGFPTKANLSSAAVIDGLQFVGDLIVKYKVQPTPAQAQATQAGAPSLFSTGKIGMHPTANWDFPGDANIKTFEWGIAAMPWPPKRYGTGRKFPLYPDQWAVLKGQKYAQAAWQLQSWLSGPVGMRLWVQGNGGLPARKSLAPVARTMLKGWKKNLTDAEFSCVLNSVNHGHITPSHALVNWSAIGDQAVNPVRDKLELGQLTGKQAAQQMEAKINAVLKQFPAPS